MSCLNQYYDEGSRTFSDNVPGYAQGAYFPEDEPGLRCHETCECCNDTDGTHPEQCDAASETIWFCPDCAFDDNEKVTILKSGHDKLFCPRCGGTWEDEKELMENFFGNLQEANREYDAHEATIKKQKHEIAELNNVFTKLARLLPNEILEDALVDR